MAAVKGKRTYSGKAISEVTAAAPAVVLFVAHCSCACCVTMGSAGGGMGNGVTLSRRLLIILVQHWSSFGPRSDAVSDYFQMLFQ